VRITSPTAVAPRWHQRVEPIRDCESTDNLVRGTEAEKKEKAANITEAAAAPQRK